jgi:hypothetical protein
MEDTEKINYHRDAENTEVILRFLIVRLLFEPARPQKRLCPRRHVRESRGSVTLP